MSGGRLVVLDRAGRDVKRYSLPDGLVTLGSDPACDIRLLLPTVSEHHATVVVRSNQTIVRNVSHGETLVNGRPVSVAALQHGDTITLGGRSLRWEYDQPAAARVKQPPELPVRRAGRPRGRGRKRASDGPQRRLDPAVHLMLELNHRASMPGAAKQVAIVQPQRRDTHDLDTNPRLLVKPHRPYAQTNKRQRNSKTETPKQDNDKTEEKSKRKTASPRISPKADLQNTTKATLWIESRKSSPRKSVTVTPKVTKPAVLSPRRAVMSAKRATPLRTVVLRKAMTPNIKYVAQAQRKTPVAKVAKIQAPSTIDHTKQAALMLMAGHSSKSRIISPPQRTAAPATPAVPAQTPAKTPPSGRKPGRPSKISMTPKITPGKQNQSYASSSGRRSRSAGNQSATILEISDSDRQSRSTRSVSTPGKSPAASPALPSPRKSALKDPARGSRKTDSKIHFDLSNLESYSDSNDVLIVSNTTKGKSFESDSSVSDSELTLHYSDTSQPNSPSPRRSLHSRSSKILGSIVGTPTQAESTYEKSTLTPESPNARKSLRGSLMVQKVLESGKKNNSRYSQRTTKSMSDGSTIVENRTKTLSPRSPRRNMESYSIVDLVSIESNDSQSSEYGSVTSHSLTFGTPQTSARKTRSTIDASLLGSSTPYVGKTKNIVNRSSRSSGKSSPIKISETINDSVSTRRSKSLTTPDRKSSVVSKRSSSLSTPENAKRPISINSTRISRSSRRTMNETDLLLLSADDDSPKTSKSVSRMSRKSLNISLTDSPKASARSSAVSSPRSPRVSTPISPRGAKSPRVSTPLSPRAGKSPRVSAPISPRASKSPRVSTPISPRNKSPRVATPISPKGAKSSRKSTPMSPNLASPQSNKPRRGSRKSASATITLPESPQESGLHTPENTHSPETASTPVLSIKSLLDSSQSSFVSQASNKRGRPSQNLKRKTIGALRSEPRRGRSGIKSKSLNLGAGRKSLIRISKDSSNMSDKTDEGALQPSNDDTITPKSTVKLIQEAVKEKHSTAKKPQSKRSIIDNLNDSDIVKQLFSSPVKRKLSQSMTEFSRKHSLEVKSSKKRTRNTIALGRTPDVSFSDHTVAVAPEEFVSPLNTPENSPNLTGIKRLFRKNTPQNDLTNIRGVKALLKTPRTRKSIKNDLTNVAGVKDMFAQKSPRNSLSNVRGVKSLFQHQKKGRKSANDLTDVRGVKQMYKGKSPKNDLRNVSGVKKTLTRRSPKNNLDDVRGVKKLFRREKSGDGLTNLSGVEALFDNSFESERNESNSEVLFDKLLGKPALKSTYAKSFSSKSAEKAQKRRAVKSLNVSFDLITNNVEEWLEKELQKRVSKHDSIPATKGRKSNVSASSPGSKSRKSLSKSNNASKNATRELQNLLIDTVEGNVPIRTSRVRTSTLIKSIPDVPNRRSASETYGAHTLPIKKRSFVEASLEKSANDSKAILPIKKRALVHSTPVKGQWNMTADASALGRVSPIVADKTRDADLTTVRTTRQVPASPKTKPATPKQKKSMLKQESHKDTPKPQTPSKKNTRTSKAKVSPKTKKSSPVKEARTTRGRKTVDNTKTTNTKKRRSSLVITKKSPILSPTVNPGSPKQTRKGRRNAIQEVTKIVLPSPKKLASPKAQTKKVTKKAAAKASPKKVTPQPTPKKTRGRGKAVVEEKPATPKSRGRPKRSNVVVTKPSPRMKPKATKTRGKAAEESIEVPKPKRGRKTTEKQISEEVVEPKRGKGKKTESLIEAPVEKTRRGRKVSEKAEPAKIAEPPKRGRNAKVSQESVSPQEKKTTRGRKTQVEKPEVDAKPKRGRSAVAINDSDANTTKGRKRKAATTENVVPAKTAKKSVEVIESKKATRGRKTVTETTEVKTQSGKLKTSVVKDSKIEINRSKAEGKSVVTSKSSRAEKKVVEVIEKKTRGAQKVQEESKPARGKKAVVETSPKGRKRKSDPPPSPVKASKKEPVRKTRKTVEDKTASPARPARRLKAQPKAVTPKATRSKRR